jgi:hypothetical protein
MLSPPTLVGLSCIVATATTPVRRPVLLDDGQPLLNESRADGVATARSLGRSILGAPRSTDVARSTPPAQSAWANDTRSRLSFETASSATS